MAFIGVDELEKALGGPTPVDIIDVRTRAEYEQLHIKGARSIPLRDMPRRAAEVPRNRLVVLY